jgi:hypothetical protein
MITINFLSQQNRVIQYIKERYEAYIPEGYAPPNNYTCDFLDLDNYKNSFTIFFDFSYYTFSLKTNESELQEFILTVYLIARNDKPKKLREKILEYTTAFYQMFDYSEQCFDGAVDYGAITSIDFYDIVEGSKNLKAAEITLTLRNEI